MEKEIKASNTVNCNIHHRIIKYGEFSVKCQELKQLASDINGRKCKDTKRNGHIVFRKP